MKKRLLLCSLAVLILLGCFALWLFAAAPEGAYATASQAEENGYLVVRDLYDVRNLHQWHRFRIRTSFGIPSELLVVQDFGTEDGRIFQTAVLRYDRDGYHLTDEEGNETSARYLVRERYPLGDKCRVSSVVLKNDRDMDHDAWMEKLLSSTLPPADPEQSTLYKVAFSRMGRRSLKTMRANTEYTEHIGGIEPLYAWYPETLADLCGMSDTIVRAEYLDCEASGIYKECHRFRVLTDYTDNAGQIIHVMESRGTTFIPGKTYYLFLGGINRQLYPDITYYRVWFNFILGEDESGLTYLGRSSFGVENIPDMDEWIRDVVKAGGYDTAGEMLRQEDAKTAYHNADHVWLVTVEEDKRILNPYTKYVEYRVEQVIKGESAEIYPPEFPADAKPGEQYILLFRQDEDRVREYSPANYLYPADSRDGRRILRLWERDAG
ncbi:MAG: hypothetical protein E7458_05740 [Ruminococcaceae bacterium]|nr:hypothetical protein [Oscillospiraceae bacterium]